MASLGTKIAALLIKKQMREIKAKLSGDAKRAARFFWACAAWS